MKRQYITPFSFEDYNPWDIGKRYDWDILIYKWVRLTVIQSCELAYRILEDSVYKTNNISLSEVKIDRTPNLLVRLYHYISDLWKHLYE